MVEELAERNKPAPIVTRPHSTFGSIHEEGVRGERPAMTQARWPAKRRYTVWGMQFVSARARIPTWNLNVVPLDHAKSIPARSTPVCTAYLMMIWYVFVCFAFCEIPDTEWFLWEKGKTTPSNMYNSKSPRDFYWTVGLELYWELHWKYHHS